MAFLAIALAVPLTGISLAFAALENETENTFLEESEPEFNSGETAETVLEEEFIEDGEVLEALEEAESFEEDADFSVFVDPAASIEYIYVDEILLPLGQEQFIAFGLLDEEAAIEQAQIYLVKAGTGETKSYPASVMVDNAALFVLSFDEHDDAAAYYLAEISYSLQGSEDIYRADFSVLEAQEAGSSYLFDVVTPALFEAFNAQAGEDGEVTVFVITEEGEFLAAESLEEALAFADPEGVNKLEAEESIVDPEALLMLEGLGQIGGLLEFKENFASNEAQGGGFSLLGALKSLFSPLEAYAATSPAREDYLVVALDPGHGGRDSGAAANGLLEKDLNWKIAQACYEELLLYTGVSVMLTRAEDENPGLQERVNRAVACGADVFVSLHNNSAATSTGNGAEVWVPSNVSYLNAETHVVGKELGSKIMAQLTSLGLTDRGVKVRDNTVNEKYPDGSLADYYSVINASRRAGIPGIIVEHAFISNSNDADKLKDDDFLIELGKADAQGIVEQYNLVTHALGQSNAVLKYQSYTENLGWGSFVYDQKVSGAAGKGIGIEALNVQLINQPTTGTIQYNAYVTGSGWEGWKSSPAVAGSVTDSKAIQALQIRLTGDMAAKYDIYYRVYVATLGWMGWARNAASAGSVGFDYAAEGFQIAIVAKGGAAPGSTATPFKDAGLLTSVGYETHVQNIGWQSQILDGEMAGTTGRSLRIEALKISLVDQQFGGSIQYNAHCAYLGWQGWKSNGAIAGTEGQARQMEAIQIRLTGEMANRYDIYYRVHAENFGWLGWAKNGESAGTAGYGFRMEALEIRLVPKGGAAPGPTSGACRQQNYVQYLTHVEDIGWQNAVTDGATAGTSGLSLRVEALAIALVSPQYTGDIQYNAHCAYIGWQGWKSNGAMAGTEGQARQMEAIQIRLTGEMATYFDIYYRVHAENFGWLGWAKNGDSAGTAGYGYRMEALQIRLVMKGGSAPGSTSGAFIEKQTVVVPSTGTPIMGGTNATVDQMARRYQAAGHSYPSTVYASKGAATIEEFCQIIFEEALAEGVRPEVVFCQAMHETGWLQFGGSVSASQCNFCGLGAVSSTTAGATFKDVREGIRAQVQHLKAYAVKGLTTSDLAYPCVDPRFDLVTKGIAPTLEELNGRWAVPGNGYGEKIASMIEEVYRS
ncbi:MAG: N-acetylmuramoyl-L-alanine amidase [Eggerthellaceae bacterium]|nr:N-acetylmuramoyl-L-alanine amidase [Eggerthellaceae bacterium]